MISNLIYLSIAVCTSSMFSSCLVGQSYVHGKVLRWAFGAQQWVPIVASRFEHNTCSEKPGDFGFTLSFSYNEFATNGDSKGCESAFQVSVHQIVSRAHQTPAGPVQNAVLEFFLKCGQTLASLVIEQSHCCIRKPQGRDALIPNRLQSPDQSSSMGVCQSPLLCCCQNYQHQRLLKAETATHTPCSPQTFTDPHSCTGANTV